VCRERPEHVNDVPPDDLSLFDWLVRDGALTPIKGRMKVASRVPGGGVLAQDVEDVLAERRAPRQPVADVEMSHNSAV